jgi:hypothetical protein
MVIIFYISVESQTVIFSAFLSPIPISISLVEIGEEKGNYKICGVSSLINYF